MTTTFSRAAIVLLTTLGLCSPAFAQLTKDAAVAKAEALLTNLQDGKTADIVKEFNATVASALPEAKLASVWPTLVTKFGAFKQVQERREGPFKDRQAVELILAFEKDTIVNRVVFDKDGKIAGLVFQPLTSAVLPPNKH
jgi:Protein of unknown function (DUF3887)